MKLANYLFFDIESTGLDTAKDRICSLKMVGFDSKGNRTDKYIIVNPTIEIPQEATDVHGITNEMVKDKPTFKRYAKSVYEFVKKHKIMVGFNSKHFDVPLLWAEFDRAGVEVDIFEPNIEFGDVYNIHKLFNPTNLSALYKLYTGKELEGAHDANNDVEATIEIFQALCTKHELKPDKIEEIALKSNYDEERNTDLFNKIKRVGEKLNFVFTFGKNKGKDISSDPSYLDWIYKNDFPNVFKNFLKNFNKNGK